jgi:DivIVA domain-containing protein
MEISAKVLRDVEFSGSLRGYNTDEVDEFLEQVAVAVDRLLAENRIAAERAETDRSGRDRTGVEDEESIRRTLVLAQRTADLAIKEAQEEAALLLDQARAEAENVIADAHQAAERLATDAEQELRDEVARLIALRESLQTESDALVSLLETERARLTESLSTALRYVEQTLTPPAQTVSAPLAANPFAGADSDLYPGETSPAGGADSDLYPGETSPAGGADSDTYSGDASPVGGAQPYEVDAPPEGAAEGGHEERAEVPGVHGLPGPGPAGSQGEHRQINDRGDGVTEDAAITGAPAVGAGSGQYDLASVARARSGAPSGEDPGEKDLVNLSGFPALEEQKDAGRRRPFRRRVDL